MGDRLLNEILLYKSGIKMGNIILLEYFNVDRIVTMFIFKRSVTNGTNYALSMLIKELYMGQCDHLRNPF